MRSFWDKLNLRPHEKRLVVIVAIVLFVVLNLWLVWPHFKDWGILQEQREKNNRTLQTYQKEIARISTYESKLKDLESQGSSVVGEGQDLDLLLTVQNQARLTGLNITRNDPRPKASSTKTNQFFEEQTLSIHVNTGNEELVNFLVSLASTNSLIRVQNLSLRPAPGQMRLEGDITLVASYQKKAPPQPAPSASPRPAAASARTSTNKAVAASGTNKPAPTRTARSTTEANLK
ncbi:MAG: type II secretion system protein M [Verrucomicrobia bacterium]|nr:type II secretion system protein M [Verrucomicrobiota bacterium]